MTVLGSVAALFLKRASGCKTMKEMMRNIDLYVGYGLYVLAAVLNIYVLRFLEYSLVLPFASLTYVWTLFLSRWVLKEKLTPRKVLGVFGILAGTIIITL
jgi:drug/metabolite transporter (DMT)-like permease